MYYIRKSDRDESCIKGWIRVQGAVSNQAYTLFKVFFLVFHDRATTHWFEDKFS